MKLRILPVLLAFFTALTASADPGNLSAIASAVLEDRVLDAQQILAGCSAESLGIEAEQFLQLKKDLACLGVVHALVLQSFKKDVGETLPVELVSGEEPLRIVDVGTDGVEALRLRWENGRSTTETFMLGYQDLSGKEQYHRLGERTQNGFQIARCLIAYRAGKRAIAIQDLADLPSVLAASLVTQARIQTEEQSEDEARALWMELLEDLRVVELEGKPQHLAYTFQKGVRAGRQAFLAAAPKAGRLLNEFGKTEWVRERKTLLDILQNRSPAVPGSHIPEPADAVHVSKALGRLAVHNNLETDIRFSFRAKGDQRVLDLSGNPTLESLQALRGLQLTELNLRGTAVDHLEDLKGMPVETLTLENSQVVSLRPLANGVLKELRTGAEIESLDGLEGNPLERLWVQSQDVRSVEPLRDSNLVYLDLAATSVEDLSPLKELPLKEIILGEKVVSLNALAGMPLRSLDFRRCPVRDLGALRDLSLETLHCGKGVFNLTALQGMPLKTFSSISEDLHDLSPLAGMPLESLTLRNAVRIRDISALEDMPLNTLILDAEHVRDLSVLRSCRELRVLVITSVKVPDLSVLSQCEELTHLAIHPDSGNIQALAALPELLFLQDHFDGKWDTKARKFLSRRP